MTSNDKGLALRALSLYWDKHLTLRLGQLVSNLALAAGYDDPFYVDDVELVRAAHNALKESQ